jgi:hypothetical protein
MAIGTSILLAVTLLVVFGAAQRVLDRMRLTDRQALFILAAILIGSLIPELKLGWLEISIGGALVPFAVCVYLFIRADSAGERWRSILAAVIGGALVLGLGWILPAEPESMWLDPNILYGLVAGLAAYLIGRSRRAAFIAGVMGVLLADLTQGIISRIEGFNVTVQLGAGGILDAVMLSGVLAVLLADFIGEIIERASGAKHKQQLAYDHGDFVPAQETHKGGGDHEDS